MGILHVQRRLWLVPGAVLCLFSDHVVRDLAAWYAQWHSAIARDRGETVELKPQIGSTGFEGTFFSLFGLTNRASSIIGPNVLSASECRFVLPSIMRICMLILSLGYAPG